MYKLEFEALYPIANNIERKLKSLNLFYNIEADSKDGRGYVVHFSNIQTLETFKAFLNENGIISR